MRVLVADDDEITRRTLCGLLDYLGHEATEARDGLEAWQMLHGADAPELVILDWMMPGMTGPEICQRLRASGKKPRQYVLMLSARDTVEDVVEGIDSGADDYLKKPFDMRELRVRIRAAERVLIEQDELRASAVTDELTGILNRRGILSRLEHELALVRRDGRPLSLLLLDIDRFKAVNDTYGHLVGDEVLAEVANRLRHQLRAYDDVGRLGGEEFGLVLPACDQVGARAVAERVRLSISASGISSAGGVVAVSVSVGVTTVSGRGQHSSRDVLATADRAMYAAKAAGRNRVEVAGDEPAPPNAGDPDGGTSASG